MHDRDFRLAFQMIEANQLFTMDSKLSSLTGRLPTFNFQITAIGNCKCMRRKVFGRNDLEIIILCCAIAKIS